MTSLTYFSGEAFAAALAVFLFGLHGTQDQLLALIGSFECQHVYLAGSQNFFRSAKDTCMAKLETLFVRKSNLVTVPSFRCASLSILSSFLVLEDCSASVRERAPPRFDFAMLQVKGPL